MTILLVEYRVDDVAGWQAVFDADPMDRAADGVTRHWIDRDADDPNHLMVGMKFATREQAQAFREALAPVWQTPAPGSHGSSSRRCGRRRRTSAASSTS